MNKPNEKDRAKIAAAKAAADLIQSGMLVGLGTGSTAAFFIDSLIERCINSNLKIQVVATSERSAKHAQNGGLTIYDIDKIKSIDITVDGADEIDKRKRMIKGGGGALLREKIIASLSKEMVVIVDASKVVDNLGAFPLPVEVVRFAHEAILYRISKLGYQASFRRNSEGGLYMTDNGNYIIDVKFSSPIKNPEKDNEMLRSIPGVVETGFFFNLAGRVLVGHPNGHVDVL